MEYLNTTSFSNLGSAKLRHTTIYGNQGYNRQNMDINNFLIRWYLMRSCIYLSFDIVLIY